MSVADRIIELRQKQHISQAKLADLVGVSRQAVSKWETGQSLPDTERMILLADVLCTDVEYLTTGRVNDAIRPPVVIKTIERIEVPVVEIQEKIVEKVVEKPVIEYVEKPVIKKVIRHRYHRNYFEYLFLGMVFFLLGLLCGLLF